MKTTTVPNIQYHRQNSDFFEPPFYLLLVDEDEDDLEMLSSELKRKNVPVRSFGLPADALYYLTLVSGTNDLPALIILACDMHRPNGHQGLLALKNNSLTSHIPVVMHSTGMRDALRVQLMEAGAIGCLEKPWNGRELDKQVEIVRDLAASLFVNKK